MESKLLIIVLLLASVYGSNKIIEEIYLSAFELIYSNGSSLKSDSDHLVPLVIMLFGCISATFYFIDKGSGTPFSCFFSGG